MNSTVSLSDPQAAWAGDAVASDGEDSVWVFPQCKYNDIEKCKFVRGDFVLIKTLVVK